MEKKPSWFGEACTLPTVEQPLRLAEFEDLFRGALKAVSVPKAGRATLTLEGGGDLFAKAKDLTDRESQCCSFFDFTLSEQRRATVSGDRVTVELQIGVPPDQQGVLDALVEHARMAAAEGGLTR